MARLRSIPLLVLALAAAGAPAATLAGPAPAPETARIAAVFQAGPAFVGGTWALEAISTGISGPVDMTTGLTGLMNTEPSSYTIEFSPNGQVAVRLGCNHGGGNWESNGNGLTIGAIASTAMGCGEEPEIGRLFAETLPLATGWSLGDDGRLRIESASGNVMVFRPLLAGATWSWIGYTDREGNAIAPADPSGYTVTLNTDGSASIQADCNSGFGSWFSDGAAFDLSNMGVSLVGCAEGTLDWLFVSLLDRAASWSMEGGNLYLTMGDDGTVATLTRTLGAP
ncbi:MAG: META domain-containing protein [Chloroflexota bacterium]